MSGFLNASVVVKVVWAMVIDPKASPRFHSLLRSHMFFGDRVE